MSSESFRGQVMNDPAHGDAAAKEKACEQTHALSCSTSFPDRHLCPFGASSCGAVRGRMEGSKPSRPVPHHWRPLDPGANGIQQCRPVCGILRCWRASAKPRHRTNGALLLSFCYWFGEKTARYI